MKPASKNTRFHSHSHYLPKC